MAIFEARGYTVERLSGPDRFTTALRIADHGVDVLGYHRQPVLVARGDDFADALAAGPAAARLGGVLVLVPGWDLTNGTDRWFGHHRDEVDTVYVVGGRQAIADHVLDQLRAAIADGD